MKTEQRYVSDELSHFVGRGKTEEEQYGLLVHKILKKGWLTYGPHHDPTIARSAELDLSKPISLDQAIAVQAVCFCDIPESDLSLHMGKYSRFGLAFKKMFLVNVGASPVFYVANNSRADAPALFKPDDFAPRLKEAVASGKVDRALYFDTTYRAIVDLLIAIDAILHAKEENRYFPGALSVAESVGRLRQLLGLDESQVESVRATLVGNADAAVAIRIYTDFILNQLFSFVKGFDASRPLSDDAHYYMEREWRVANNVHFALSDVSRVFFPSSYASRFRADLPDYVGQISFTA